MRTFTLPIDNAPDIRFDGELLGNASTVRMSYENHNEPVANQRWTDLALYRTNGGKFVCHQIANTNKPGEHSFFKGAVCDTEAEVFEFFGDRWLAKELYSDAGLDFVIYID